MRNKNHRLVYSTDPSQAPICKACKESPCECKKVTSIDPATTELKIRLETKGRGGKAVSVIFEIPHNPDFVSKLAKKVKSHCGSGGTAKDGRIEIQGDHRTKIKAFLEGLGFKVKLAGGGK